MLKIISFKESTNFVTKNVLHKQGNLFNIWRAPRIIKIAFNQTIYWITVYFMINNVLTTFPCFFIDWDYIPSLLFSVVLG